MRLVLLILGLMFCHTQQGQAQVNFSATQKPVLKLFYLPTCPHSVRVLKYLDQIHKTVPMVNLYQNPKGKEELKRVGGLMQVPCLVIDGVAMYDDSQIIDWLSGHQDQLDPAPSQTSKL